MSVFDLTVLSTFITILALIASAISIGMVIIYTVKSRDWRRGVVPTSEEVANIKVTELANRLKGKSDKETLTNILQWQQTNISFWLERYPLSLITRVFLIGLIASPFVLFVPWSEAWLIASLLFFMFIVGGF